MNQRHLVLIPLNATIMDSLLHYFLYPVITQVLSLYRDSDAFEDLRKVMRTTAGPKEEQRQALLYELNSSGKYFAFKEQLKHSVIKIVREKYLQTTNFTSQQHLQVSN